MILRVFTVCIPLMLAECAFAQHKDAYIYKQSTGELLFDGKKIATGYSGNGKGLNNSKLEKEANVGPIPRGEWKIGTAFEHKTKGPLVMELIPQGHTAQHRSGFLIHGDNKNMDKSASEGCIILDRSTREMIANSKVKTLIVEE